MASGDKHFTFLPESGQRLLALVSRNSYYALALPIFSALTICLASLLVLSWHWPIYHDAQIFYHVGFRILEGKMPYKDIFMMDFPVVYLINSLGILLFGWIDPDVGHRLTDLTWLAFIGIMGYHFCKKQSRILGVSFGIFFACYHISLGPDNQMQRDYLMLPFLIGSCHFFANYLEGNKTKKNLLFCGIFLSFAILIKPHPIILFLFFGTILFGQKTQAKESIHALCLIICGIAGVVALVVLWLVLGGALGDFFEIIFFYLPIYNRIGTYPSLLADVDKVIVFTVFSAAISALSPKEMRARNTILFAACMYGFCHFHLQNFPYAHRLYPMRALFALMVFYNLRHILVTGNLLPKLFVFAVAIWSAFAFSPLGVAIDLRMNARYEYRARQEKLADLKAAFERAPVSAGSEHEGNTLHFFDVISGFWYASTAVNSVSNSRCYSPFLFAESHDEYAQYLQKKCLQELAAAHPKVIAFNDYNYLSPEPFAILRNKALADYISLNYRIFADKPTYRIYIRKRS